MIPAQPVGAANKRRWEQPHKRTAASAVGEARGPRGQRHEGASPVAPGLAWPGLAWPWAPQPLANRRRWPLWHPARMGQTPRRGTSGVPHVHPAALHHRARSAAVKPMAPQQATHQLPRKRQHRPPAPPGRSPIPWSASLWSGCCYAAQEQPCAVLLCCCAAAPAPCAQKASRLGGSFQTQRVVSVPVGRGSVVLKGS